MTDLEYLLLTSIAPVGALVIAALLYFGTRAKAGKLHSGE